MKSYYLLYYKIYLKRFNNIIVALRKCSNIAVAVVWIYNRTIGKLNMDIPAIVRMLVYTLRVARDRSEAATFSLPYLGHNIFCENVYISLLIFHHKQLIRILVG